MRYAQRLKGELERAISLGTYSPEKHKAYYPTSRIALANAISNVKSEEVLTFRRVAQKWILTINHLAAGTKENYIKSLNFWLKHFHNELITNINYSSIATIANSEGWKSKNYNNMLIPLRKVFELAYFDELIAQNPTAKIKNQKVQKVPPNPLTLNEVNFVLDFMQNNFDEQVFNYFEFAFFTGCRPEEIIALKWESVNFETSSVNICRVRTARVDRESTKTSCVRDVELNSRALAAIINQKKHTFIQNDYVFHNPETNMRWNSEASERKEYWKPTLLALKLKGLS